MLLPSYPTPTTAIVKNIVAETISPLCLKDSRLKEEIPAQESRIGNLSDLHRWIYPTVGVSIGTTDKILLTTRDFFAFGKVRAGDLMEAYGLLYRLRWVKYRQGNPTYELTDSRERLDRYYSPHNEFQKRRFDYTTAFMKTFDRLPAAVKAQAMSGQPLNYLQLPQDMQDSLRRAMEALYDEYASKVASYKKPDIFQMNDAQITIEDESKPGTGIRELMLKITTNQRGSSFWWNDYDKRKNYQPYSRPAAFVRDPVSNEAFSREKMLAAYPKLRQAVTVPQGEWPLAELLKRLASTQGINFVTNAHRDKRALPFSCDRMSLSDALDAISAQYGGWEWEASTGDFVVMRSRNAPRRRDAPKNDRVLVQGNPGTPR